MDVKARAAESWFGYGRWEAPYWFVGIEPGGTDDAASYESWQRLGGGELIDARQHHLDSGFTRWHGDGPRRTQPTWRRLIQTLFAFKALPTDLDAVCAYQRTQMGSADGETAVVELGALHAPGLSTEVDRKSFRDARIDVLHERMVENAPVFALCYGLTFKDEFARVVGAPFDAEGFAWCGPTLCVMAPGPTSFLRGKPTPWAKPEWWIALGRKMRATVDERSTDKP